MKILILSILSINFLFANITNYTIRVCVTSTLEYAKACQNKIEKSMKEKAFIVKKNSRYFTNLNIFDNLEKAKESLKNGSSYLKEQKAYPKLLTEDILNELNNNKSFIDLDQNNILEDLYNVSLKEFDNQKNNSKNSLKNRKRAVNNFDFDELILKVDSQNNIMELFAKKSNEEILLRSYVVSTGKNNIKKPQGLGFITEISLNPVWYPTSDTKKSFAKKGIILPDVVPPNHKYNYMGEAKLNLSHIVDGNSTYRIHGTLNENTLGYSVSAGCIRMKNEEVVELANLIEDFSIIYGLHKVKVILS